jgi:hypothetical protein
VLKNWNGQNSGEAAVRYLRQAFSIKLPACQDMRRAGVSSGREESEQAALVSSICRSNQGEEAPSFCDRRERKGGHPGGITAREI